MVNVAYNPYSVHPPAGRSAREAGPRIPEALITDIWLREAIPGRSFTTLDGEEIVLVSTGIPNRINGPDFLHGVILYRGIECTGAIEIHRTEKEWGRHGHCQDRRYDQVLLHVVLFGAKSIRTAGIGARFTICLADQLTRPLREALRHAREDRVSRQSSPLPPEVCSSASLRTRTAMIILSSAERFSGKIVRIEDRFQELRACVQNDSMAQTELLFELVADAFGYPRNRTQMRSVARSLPIRFWETSEIDTVWDRAVALLGAAGELDFFSSRLDTWTAHSARERWMHLRPRIPRMDRIVWNHGGTRPGNAPLNRLLVLAELISFLIDGSLLRNLLDACLLIKRDPAVCARYFERTFDLGGRPLSGQLRTPAIGRERIHELVVNIAAPFLAWYGRRNGFEHLVSSAERLFFQFPSSARNRVTGRMEKQLSVRSTGNAGIQQGMIEMAERFCSASRCVGCLVGNEVSGL